MSIENPSSNTGNENEKKYTYESLADAIDNEELERIKRMFGVMKMQNLKEGKTSELVEMINELDRSLKMINHMEDLVREKEEIEFIIKESSEIKSQIEEVFSGRKEEEKNCIAELQISIKDGNLDDEKIKTLLRGDWAKGEIKQWKMHKADEKSATIFFAVENDSDSYTAEIDFEKQSMMIIPYTMSRSSSSK